MKISILTLTDQRDKCVDDLLAKHLQYLGHDAEVRNYIYAGREAVCYEKPDVIVHPFPGGQYKYDFIELCKEWGIEVIVRRGEAGMGKAEFNKLDEERKKILLGNWDYSPHVDLELTWGQEFTNIITEQGWMPSEKLRSCGGFAFDAYFDPEFKRNRAHERTVLFASGFSTCDCGSEYCELGLPEKSEYHEQIYKVHRRARDKWIAAINKMAGRFSEDWRFELKVRPGEMTREYQDKLSPIIKIHPQSASSAGVLRNIDILVHSGSTMAIEAHLMDIPSFNFCNVNPDPLLSDVSPRLETYDELEWNVHQAKILQSNINEGVYFVLRKNLYGLIDGKACERAASYIHQHITAKEIETDIPDIWPKTTKYHIDMEKVRLEKQEGDERWLCPCCRNLYYTDKGLEIAKCPYCGMQIEIIKTASSMAEAVIK